MNLESLITTDKGYKKYQDIVIGDKVLTHKGRFRPVTKKTFRSYQGEIHKVTLWGCNLPITVTEDHAFLDNNEFMAVKDLEEFQSPKIQEMSDIQEIDVADRVYSGAVYDNYIYTKYPKQRISQKQIDLILKLHNEGFSKAEITNKVFGKTKKNSNYSSVYNTIKNNTKRKKCAINRKIDLSVRFGRIIGYYAAEGSSGSDGRYIEFALGKHEQHYVDQISEDIESCFGVSPKIYYSKDNVCRVIVTSRIVQELIKSICPGDCYTKTIDPAILYSNEYFIKGFLQGVLNGDGCLYDEKYITIQLASKQLICQIRNCLLIKDISSSLIKPSWRKKNSVIRGKKVNQSEVYRLDIRGFNANKLYKNIYDINHKDSNFTKNPYYWSEDSFGFHKIRERSKEFYSGRVYNLEVDEDHSYCINDICCHNCFATDSDGFFKRSLIETCVAHEGKIYKKKEDCYFKPRLYSKFKICNGYRSSVRER
jgi:intein/homing endonuclease